MKKTLILFVFLLSSCDWVQREAYYPGGNLGYYADKSLYLARSHEQRVDRYLLGLALLAPLVAATAQTPEDGRAGVDSIDQVYARLLKLKKAAQSCDLSLRYGPASDRELRIRQSEYRYPKDDLTVSGNFEPVLNEETKKYAITIRNGTLKWGDELRRYSYEGKASIEAAQRVGGDANSSTWILQEIAALELQRGTLNIALTAEGAAQQLACQNDLTNTLDDGNSELTETVLFFETRSHAVHKALFRLTSSAAENLNLDLKPSKLLQLDPTDLFSLLTKARKVARVLGTYLASYRDSIVIFSDALGVACGRNPPKEVKGKCQALQALLAGSFHQGNVTFAEEEQLYLPLRNAMDQAKALAEQPELDWRFGKLHVHALALQISHACKHLRALAHVETADEEIKNSDVKCDTENYRAFVNSYN